MLRCACECVLTLHRHVTEDVGKIELNDTLAYARLPDYIALDTEVIQFRSIINQMNVLSKLFAEIIISLIHRDASCSQSHRRGITLCAFACSVFATKNECRSFSFPLRSDESESPRRPTIPQTLRQSSLFSQRLSSLCSVGGVACHRGFLCALLFSPFDLLPNKQKTVLKRLNLKPNQISHSEST